MESNSLRAEEITQKKWAMSLGLSATLLLLDCRQTHPEQCTVTYSIDASPAAETLIETGGGNG